jgi:hypothetical protein
VRLKSAELQTIGFKTIGFKTIGFIGTRPLRLPHRPEPTSEELFDRLAIVGKDLRTTECTPCGVEFVEYVALGLP